VVELSYEAQSTIPKLDVTLGYDAASIGNALKTKLSSTTAAVTAGSAMVDKKCVCRAYHNTSQNAVNGDYTYLALNSETTDTDNIHSTTVNNSRLTCKTAGMYLAQGQVEFAANGTGTRIAVIRRNGNVIMASNCAGTVPSGTGYTTAIVSTMLELSVNDYVELGVYQTSGVSLPVGANIPPVFSMVKIA
jgi:hypothetical protein